MDWIQAIVLGLVQGITEFLPISSTAHLRILPHWLGWDDPGAEYSAVIQLGTLLAVIVYFWKDVKELFMAFLYGLRLRKPLYSVKSRMAWSIIFGTLPVALLGLILKDWIKTEARDLWVIGTALIVLGCLLWVAERFSEKKKDIQHLNFIHIQCIGICQALALIPGCSRSGSTIMGGLIVGMKINAAARFSFLLGLPAILASGIFEFYELLHSDTGTLKFLNLCLGIVSAFVFGYLSIEFLLKFLQTHGTLVFVIYRLLLGSTILFILWSH